MQTTPRAVHTLAAFFNALTDVDQQRQANTWRALPPTVPHRKKTAFEKWQERNRIKARKN
jgi:hypothetical protein